MKKGRTSMCVPFFLTLFLPYHSLYCTTSKISQVSKFISQLPFAALSH